MVEQKDGMSQKPWGRLRATDLILGPTHPNPLDILLVTYKPYCLCDFTKERIPTDRDVTRQSWTMPGQHMTKQ